MRFLAFLYALLFVASLATFAMASSRGEEPPDSGVVIGAGCLVVGLLLSLVVLA